MTIRKCSHHCMYHLQLFDDRQNECLLYRKRLCDHKIDTMTCRARHCYGHNCYIQYSAERQKKLEVEKSRAGGFTHVLTSSGIQPTVLSVRSHTQRMILRNHSKWDHHLHQRGGCNRRTCPSRRDSPMVVFRRVLCVEHRASRGLK